MEEVINALVNQPEAMQCVRQVLKGRSVPLAQVQLLAPLENPGSLWPRRRTTKTIKPR